MKRIAHITDIHLNEPDPVNLGINAQRNWQTLLNDIVAENISDIVFGGDIGDPFALAWFFSTVKKFSFNICLGNHDQYKNVAMYFNRTSSVKDALCYAQEDDVFRTIFLDTSLERISSGQVEWLKLQLDSPKNIIIFMHHPVLKVNTPIDRAYPLENRDEIQATLINSKKNITIFCGHYHLADEQTFENIRQIITPAASYQVVKDAAEVAEDGSRFGYRIIELRNDKIRTTIKMFKNKNG